VVSEKSIKEEKGLAFSLLTFKDLPVYAEYVLQVKLKGLKVKWQSKWLNAVSGTAGKTQIWQIASLSIVKKLDIVYKLRKGSEPEVDQNSETQKLNNVEQLDGVNILDYGDSYTQLQQINVPAAYDSGFTGRNNDLCYGCRIQPLVTMHFLSMDIVADGTL
jgi:hypothetical protein